MEQNAPPGTRKAILGAVVLGISTGLLARLLYAVLPDPWTTLANTSALWGLAPYLVGYASRARIGAAAALGLLTLSLTVATWAVLTPSTPRELILWGLVAIGAGATCGAAGTLTRSSQAWTHRVGLAVMAAIILGEGIYGIMVIGGPQWWVEAFIGVALPITAGRTWGDKLIAVGGAAAAGLALVGAYLLYDAVAVG